MSKRLVGILLCDCRDTGCKLVETVVRDISFYPQLYIQITFVDSARKLIELTEAEMYVLRCVVRSIG